MILFSDPFILLITLIVIVVVLVVGICIYFSNKNKQKNEQLNLSSISPARLDIGAHVKTNCNIVDSHSKLSLVRINDNPYAPELIAVMLDSQKIGYVNVEAARIVAPIMDSGSQVYVELRNKNSDGYNIRIFSK